MQISACTHVTIPARFGNPYISSEGGFGNENAMRNQKDCPVVLVTGFNIYQSFDEG